MAKSPLVNIIIGAVIALAGSFGLEYLQRNWSAEALAAAYRGEIAARIKFSNRQNYIEGLLRNLEADKVWEPVDRPPSRSAPVFSATAGQIGILGPELSERIARYYMLDSLSDENLRLLGDGRYLRFEKKDKEFFLKKFIELEERLKQEGESIIGLLEQMSVK